MEEKSLLQQLLEASGQLTPEEIDRVVEGCKTARATTAAERIAARFENDGSLFYDVDGYPLYQALEDVGPWKVICDPENERTRYIFDDANGRVSVITIVGGAWDLGYPDCWCWAGMGHSEDCEMREE